MTNAFSGQAQNVNIVDSTGADVDVTGSVFPAFTPGTPTKITAIGAYNNTNDDIEFLNKSDNTGGLFVEVAGPVVLSSGNLVNVQYQSYSNGGSTLLKTVATLPAAGAFTLVPTQGSDGSILVPQNAKEIVVYITYNRGAVNGKAAHKFYGYNGSEIGQLMAPDFTYNAIAGAPSTGAFPITYVMRFNVTGLLYFGIISAETGVTATPGTCGAQITFA